MSDGDCFPVAFNIVVRDGADDSRFRLCHGTVIRQDDGLAHAHAWVEHTVVHDLPYEDRTYSVPLDLAIDRSNGNDLELPAAFYRNLGRAEDVHVYSRDEAMRLAVTTGHYGPWTES